jgi:hypothetical protein
MEMKHGTYPHDQLGEARLDQLQIHSALAWTQY